MTPRINVLNAAARPIKDQDYGANVIPTLKTTSCTFCPLTNCYFL